MFIKKLFEKINMRCFRLLLLTLYLSLFYFMLISAFIGDNGMSAYKELESYRNRLCNNLTELKEINRRLKESCRKMENAEQMMLLSRNLGMVEQDENVIILTDFQNNSIYDLGARYSSNIKDKNRVFNVDNIRFISFFLAVIMVAFMVLAKKGTNGNRKRKSKDIENCIPDIAQ